MFSAQSVQNDKDRVPAVSVQYTNEPQSVPEITSHNLIGHGDLGQGDGHLLGQTESQALQSLLVCQSDVTSVQGSYVSLLSDISTIEQADEYHSDQIAGDVPGSVNYANATFDGHDNMQELAEPVLSASLQSENLVTYQNQNIAYDLTNPTVSAPGIQQFVIIQPLGSSFIGQDDTADASNTLIHLPNTSDTPLNFEINKELEDAVANITEHSLVDADDQTNNEISPEQSYLVSTNSQGEIREIHVVQGEENWNQSTQIEQVSASKRTKSRSKCVKRKEKSSVAKPKEASTHLILKKFSMDDLNSIGKSKQELFNEYLEKTKVSVKQSTSHDDCAYTDTKLKLTAEHFESNVSECEAKANVNKDDIHVSNGNNVNLDFTINEEIISTSISELDKETTCKPDTQILTEHIVDQHLMESLPDELNEVHNALTENPAMMDALADIEIHVPTLTDITKGKDEASLSLSAEHIEGIGTRKIRTKPVNDQDSKTGTLTRKQLVDMKAEQDLKVTENVSKKMDRGNMLNKVEVVKQKLKRTSLKRKKHMSHELKQSCKLPKMDIKEKLDQTENDTLEDSVESRVLEDFCRFFRLKDKCTLNLEPITLKLVNPKEVLVIELDVENAFTVSALEKGISTDGFTKYYISLSVHEDVARMEKIDNNVLPHKTGKQKMKGKDYAETEEQKLKCSKRLRPKCRRRNKVSIDCQQPVSDKISNKCDNSLCSSNENTILAEDITTSITDFSDLETIDTKPEITGNVITKIHEVEYMQSDNEDSKPVIQDPKEENDPIDTCNVDDHNTTVKPKRNKVGKGSSSRKSKDDHGRSKDSQEPSAKNYIVRISDEGVRMYVCPICGYMSKYTHNAKKHVYEHTAPRDWVCEKCGMSFKSNNNLQKHRIVHQHERPFPCPLCPQTFKRRRLYECLLCGKEMTVRQNMDVHVNQHTGHRPWQCEVCGLGFKGPSNLRAHMHQHEAEMKFPCAICFRKFRDRGTYRQHLKRHLGEKSHVCEHCGKSFVITSDLKKHIRTHTGEKPFSCSICNQHFSDGSSLVRHEKMHTAKFKYECNACKRQYTRKDLCKKHIKKAHSALSHVDISQVSIEDSMQVSKDTKTKTRERHASKMPRVTKKSSSRNGESTADQNRVRKYKKSWQTLTEEASKRYKEQTVQNLPAPSQYVEYTHPVVPTFSIVDYQQLGVRPPIQPFYSNMNLKYPDEQKPVVTCPGYGTQNIMTTQGPLVYQSYTSESIGNRF